jgi:hypothetical protein
MPARTVEELQSALDSSMAWRRIELSALRAELERSANRSATSPLSRALARGALAMLYAHWEGFTQDGFRAYVDFLSRRRLKFEELNDGLLRTVFASLHRRLLSGDEAASQSLVDAVRRPSTSRAQIPRNGMVNTRSNLRSGVLREIFDSVGLDPSDFDTKAQLIDRSLCDARNEIAHGRELFPSADSFAALHQEVMSMMETVRDRVLEAARTQAYMAAPGE